MSALPRTASLGAGIVVADSRPVCLTQLLRHERAAFSKCKVRDPE